MDDDELAVPFEAQRGRLWAMAYRMLGSVSEAEDAVQEGWLRLSRTGGLTGGPDGPADGQPIENLGAWLTTVVGRICLDMLRSRQSRREDTLDGAVHLPDPILGPAPGPDPESEAVLADSVGFALLVVLETLAPAERLAFVLHDLFGLSFDEIAPIVQRTPVAARQLASRARRRVQHAAPGPGANPSRQREVVQAFLAASRGGDFDALLRVLDPGIVLRVDTGGRGTGSQVVTGAQAVAGQSVLFSRAGRLARLVQVNGRTGAISVKDGHVLAVLSFEVTGDRIVRLDILADPDRLRRLTPPA